MKFIKVGRLTSAGHVTRKEESDPAKKMPCTLIYLRLKLRWCNELEEDVAWVGCRYWRVKKGVAKAIWGGEVPPRDVVPMVVEEEEQKQLPVFSINKFKLYT
jgi:hypothetical protein